MVKVWAPAKINLALHVTGRRADGYHTLDSLVAFAWCGDRIMVEPDDKLTLQIDGDFGYGLSTTDNLVLKAARLMDPNRGAEIWLSKYLPVASGLGGGSADAAATIRALAKLWDLPLPDPQTLLSLGADVPVCLTSEAARMQGIGEVLTPVAVPPAHIVLVNTRDAVSTAAVFNELDTCSHFQDRPTTGLSPIPPLPDAKALAAYLALQRNDLEWPACNLCPEIALVLMALSDRKGCLLARMSGSGGTCFGIFEDEDSAYWAARMIKHYNKHWWVEASSL